MPARVIAIGDVHGCSRALDSLLGAIGPAGDDLFVPLGDYVDRGPDSRGVIERLIELSATCRVNPLLGNHEMMMLSALKDRVTYHNWLSCGGDATLESYGGSLAHVPPEHLGFLSDLRRYFETDTHLFFHANYVADLPPDQQPDYALLWEHVDTMTPGPHQSGKTAIVGHTPQQSGEVLNLGHLIGIDTFCAGGGWLTALDVISGHIWQAREAGEVRESTLD